MKLIIYLNFVSFVLKCSLAVGIFSAIGFTIGYGVAGELTHLWIIFLYATYVGFMFALVPSIIGFWVLFPFRTHKNISVITYVIGFILSLACLGVFFSNSEGRTEIWFWIFFPIFPGIASIVFFRKMVKKHLQGLKKTKM